MRLPLPTPKQLDKAEILLLTGILQQLFGFFLKVWTREVVVFHAPRGFASRRDAPETAARHRHLPRAFRGACTQGGSEFPVPFRCRGGDAAGRPGGPRAAAKKLQRPLPRPRKYPPAAPAGCPSGTRTSRRSCTRARAHTEVGRTQCETCVGPVGVDIVQGWRLGCWLLS